MLKFACKIMYNNNYFLMLNTIYIKTTSSYDSTPNKVPVVGQKFAFKLVSTLQFSILSGLFALIHVLSTSVSKCCTFMQP